jgi:putative oxidoreductase
MDILDFYDGLTARLRAAGDFVWPLALRLIMFWEFWEAGITKLRGSNWFADIPWASWQKGFPWPFELLPAELNWLLATWGELVFAFLLLFGLFTRFAAVSLVVITMVATAAVHWPAEWSGLTELWAGYLITAKDGGNFKLPLLFLLLLLPLVFHGGGRLSLDHLLLRVTGRGDRVARSTADSLAAALALAVLALATIWVEPAWGWALLVAALLAATLPGVTGKR